MKETLYSNGYQKYSQYLEIIRKMCDDMHFVGRVDSKDNGYYPEYEHYILDNGLHVYIKEDNIMVLDGELGDSFDIRCFSMFSTPRKSVKLEIGCNKASIAYGTEGTQASVFGEGKDYYFLPPSNMDDILYDKSHEQYEFFGDLPLDMSTILEQAIKRAKNDETRNAYMKALELHDTVLDMVRGVEQIQPEEQGRENDSLTPLRQGYAQQVQTEQQVLTELGKLSLSQLEEKLRTTQEQNGSKKQELEDLLKKKNLIEQIIQAQREGNDLDSQILDAKAKIADIR